MTERYALRAGLVRLRRAWRDGPPREGLAYDGPADFVLRHGQLDELRPTLPPGMRRGLPRRCFANAITVAVLYGLEYVEGFACHPALPFPVHHAWNRAPAGELVDTTWADFPLPVAAYMGVAFAVERADDCTWNGDASVLDDFQRGWPLLREPWTGEPEHAWPWSDRLEALRAQRDGDPRRARLLASKVLAD